jgi:hypothetical protein
VTIAPVTIAIVPATIYVLCMGASAACAVLLARTWSRTRARLLLWTAVSFALLTLNNFLLVLDMLVFRDLDLWPARAITFHAAMLVLLYGFIWEADR